MSDVVPPDELRELQLEYLVSTAESVASIQQHAQSLSSRKLFKSSFPVLLYLTHQLKGSGGSLGFAEITTLAGKMSEELNHFLDDGGPRPAPGDLSRTLLAVAARLQTYVEAERSRLSQA